MTGKSIRVCDSGLTVTEKDVSGGVEIHFSGVAYIDKGALNSLSQGLAFLIKDLYTEKDEIQ